MTDPPQSSSFDAVMIIDGTTAGTALVLDEPLSFWGGFDAASGLVSDVHHPQHGASLTGRIVVMPSGRGSSSASSVLAEAARCGTAPAALLVLDADEILALGLMVAEELYAVTVPLAVLQRSDYSLIETGDHIEVDRGRISRN